MKVEIILFTPTGFRALDPIIRRELSRMPRNTLKAMIEREHSDKIALVKVSADEQYPEQIFFTWPEMMRPTIEAFASLSD